MSIFKEAIDALSLGEFRKPHKYIALLSMIFILKRKKFVENKIYFNEDFKEIFTHIFKKISKNTDRNRPYTPFFYLKNSNLVHLVANEGYDISSIHKIGSAGALNQHVAYATLTESLFMALQNPSLQSEIVGEIRNNLLSYKTEVHSSSVKFNATELIAPVDIPSTQCFLSYLNSLQRLNGGNQNALAEFQAKTLHFPNIAASHPLEEAIAADMRHGAAPVIVTGHAGDGKTTLAFAVYRRLRNLPSTHPLKEEAQHIRLAFSCDGHDSVLIKDLSEQERSRDGQLLQDLLDKQKRCLLVSNTGALLDFFTSQAAALAQENATAARADVESKLLDTLKQDSAAMFIFAGRPFKIYNLARYDNLALALDTFEKMLAPQQWQRCRSCQRQKACPVAFNHSILHSHATIRERLFLVYLRLQAYGVRLTMRQITEHLAYCITGGLREEDLCCAESSVHPYFGNPRFHFYNLFFGDDGMERHADVAEMAAVRAIRAQDLGAQPLPCIDKQLWHVQGVVDSCFSLPPQAIGYFQKLCRQEAMSDQVENSAALRTQVRRMLFCCAEPANADLTRRLQEEFLRSPGTQLYHRMEAISRLEKSRLLDDLFHVLQEHFTGMHLAQRTSQHGGNQRLYITINRPHPLQRQSVQATQCSVSWADNFSLDSVMVGQRRAFFLQGRHAMRHVQPLEMSIPFWDYVLRRHKGELGILPRSTFSQRLDAFKAQIIQALREPPSDDPPALRVLRYRSDFNLTLDEYVLTHDILEVRRGIC